VWGGEGEGSGGGGSIVSRVYYCERVISDKLVGDVVSRYSLIDNFVCCLYPQSKASTDILVRSIGRCRYMDGHTRPAVEFDEPGEAKETGAAHAGPEWVNKRARAGNLTIPT